LRINKTRDVKPIWMIAELFLLLTLYPNRDLEN
jgi:hypothetical protein